MPPTGSTQYQSPHSVLNWTIEASKLFSACALVQKSAALTHAFVVSKSTVLDVMDFPAKRQQDASDVTMRPI